MLNVCTAYLLLYPVILLFLILVYHEHDIYNCNNNFSSAK